MMIEAMIESWVIPSSLMIAALLAMRFVLRGKISLRLQYALWLVVLVRLLIPGELFHSPFSTDTVVEKMDLPGAIQQVYFSANEDVYEQQYIASYHETVRWHESKGKPLDPVVAQQQAAKVARQSLELDLERMLFSLWLMGMALMTAVIVACNAHLACQLRKRRWALDVPASLLPVYVTEAVPTPCVFGFFRPVIYLTPDAARGSQIRAHVLEHELTHYRHGDHVWSVLRSLCLVLHWYNPLVWIAAKVSRADAELACDEGALARLGESQRGDYGRTLIGLTCSAPISELLLTATTMTGSAGSIRERIKLLMKRPRNTILTVTAVILLVTLIVGCTFSATPATTPPATEPSGPSVPEGSLPEATIPGVDNDMSYTDQDLPIPDDLTGTTLTYALPMEQAMADYADKNPRELTEQELKEFRTAFTALDENGNANPAACFLLPYYDDISEMDGGEFLAYFPTDQEGTKEEFELLKAKYPDFFGDWTFDAMPIPIHRYDPKAIEAVVSRFGNIHWPELDEGVHYLEETGCYYNYTSDFGLGGFYAREGFVFDGGAVVYSDFSALHFTETAGYYTIRAHYPLIEPTTHSSHPMIPAPDPRDAEITALVTAFNRAYQENLYMGTENPYDHLTVLALDPEITVTWEGKTVPLSEFHKNIQFLHDKQTWYHHTRSYGDETQEEYAMSSQVSSIQYDGDTAIVVTTGGVQFADDDPAAPRGEGAVHKFLLVQVDGIWLVADVLSEGEGFDSMYKNNPDFDVEKLISN